MDAWSLDISSIGEGIIIITKTSIERPLHVRGDGSFHPY